jgi:hypothetical protein
MLFIAMIAAADFAASSATAERSGANSPRMAGVGALLGRETGLAGNACEPTYGAVRHFVTMN